MFFKKNFQKIRFYHGFNIPSRVSFDSSHINFLFKFFPTKYIFLLTQIQRHPYHLVTKSPWPFLVSLFLGMLVLGVVGLIQNMNMSFIYFHIGFYGLILILGRWFLDIWIESLLGHHTRKVARGLRLGFFLMILSEVMFFWAFFWTLFHYTLCLDIWTGHKWPYLHEQPNWFGPSLIGTAFLVWSCIWLSEAAIWWKWLSYNIFMYYIFCTMWCGLMFLYIQIEEFLFVELTFNCGSHGSIFFMLTGFHFFHVLLGLIFITTMYCRLLYNWYIPVQEKFILLNITSWYWQFVDYVWLFVYWFLYIVYGYLNKNKFFIENNKICFLIFLIFFNMILNVNYFYLIFFFFFSIILISLLFLLSFIFFSKKKIKTIKKKSLYECGFESLGNAKIKINIQYINIALLFIIFDLEILFILPWIVSANFIGILGLFTIYLILNFFVFGFVYEYLVNALNWNQKKYNKL